MSINFEKLDKMMGEIEANIDRVKLDILRTGDDPAFLAVECMMRGSKPDMRRYLKMKGVC